MGFLSGATGKTVTIVRADGDLTSSIYIKPGRGTTSPYAKEYVCDSDAAYVAPRYVGGTAALAVGRLAEGDLIKDGLTYYLVITLNKVEMDSVFYLKGILFKCNSIVDVSVFDTVTDTFKTFTAGVPCLIAREQTLGHTDSSTSIQVGVVGEKAFYLYAQSDAGLGSKPIISDQDGRKFRVGDYINPFFSKGIMEAKVIWENR